jgi:hypothetical protein
MKQFSRCKNCRQWYVQAFTTVIEISKGDMQRRKTVWCLRCVAEAEKRSWSAEIDTPEDESVTLFTGVADIPEMTGATPVHDSFQQLLLEHTYLMDQALHADEAVLIPRIKHYLEQCQDYQEYLDIPEHAQRLAGHQHYWEAFLKVLK